MVTEIKPYVGSSQLLDTTGCWVGRINQLCFHSKMLQLFPWKALGRRVAAAHGEINPTPETSLNLSDRGCSHTHCPSLPMGYEMKINPRQGAHGVASAPLVTQAQIKSSDLPVPRFLSCPWDRQCTSPFHRAAVMVVNLMPLKHSDASTHARTRAEAASQQNTGSCPRGSCSLLAGHTDSSQIAPQPFEESAKLHRAPKCKDGEMMTGFLRWCLTAARSHCGEKDRKQNITIGRRPWKALENKNPALNNSQQNNHKCRTRKRPNYAVLFAFYHCSQSKCLSLSIYKFEMPAQILKSNTSNTGRHLKL